MLKPVFADLKTGFRRPQNRFLPSQKPVFSTSKPVFADVTTCFRRLQNRFFSIPKPVFADPKTGFWRP